MFRKEWINKFSFFLKSVTYSFPWKTSGMISFYYSKTFLIMSNNLLHFSVYESIYKLFGNNNLIWKLQFRYVGLLVEVSVSFSITYVVIVLTISIAFMLIWFKMTDGKINWLDHQNMFFWNHKKAWFKTESVIHIHS